MVSARFSSIKPQFQYFCGNLCRNCNLSAETPTDRRDILGHENGVGVEAPTPWQRNSARRKKAELMTRKSLPGAAPVYHQFPPEVQPSSPKRQTCAHPKSAAWISPEPGDICVASIPFTDCSALKTRPALVLHLDGPDLVLAPMTSHAPRSEFDVALSAWGEAGLKRPGTVRCARIGRVSSILVYRVLGRVQPPDWRIILEVASTWFNQIVASNIFYELVPALENPGLRPDALDSRRDEINTPGSSDQ